MLRTTIILFLFISLTFGQVFAQKSFFIRPIIESKTSFGSSSWHKTSFMNMPYFGDAPFVLQSKDLIWQNNLSPIHIGLGFGYNFPNEKISVECDFSQDGTQSGYQLFSNKYDPEFGYGAGILGSHAGISFTRITLQFMAQCFETKKQMFTIHFFGGISYGMTGGGDPLKNLIPEQTTMQIEPNTYLEVNSGLYSLNERAFFWQLGIAGEVNRMKEGKAKVELFTFSIYYIHGKRPLSVKPVTINVIENNNLIGSYNYNSYGNGSGINFQVSRKLQFNLGKRIR